MLSGKKKWKLLAPQYTPLLMDRFGREMAASFDLPHAEFQFPNLSQAASLAIELEQVGDQLLHPFLASERLENTTDINNTAIWAIDKDRHVSQATDSSSNT